MFLLGSETWNLWVEWNPSLLRGDDEARWMCLMREGAPMVGLSGSKCV